MTDLARPHFHHLALTVSDPDASVAWYERVFGLRFQAEIPHRGGFGRLLADDELAMVIVLHAHGVNDGTAFAETTNGLDHVSFAVPTRSELEDWQRHLEDCGVARSEVADRPATHSGITDAPYGSVLVFRDPDNIQLELFAPAATPPGPAPASSS
ncbi:MAG: VOC family protein [Acidimicrobiales bacterium]